MKPSEVFVEFIKYRLMRSDSATEQEAETIAHNLMCDPEFNEVLDRTIEDYAHELEGMK